MTRSTSVEHMTAVSRPEPVQTPNRRRLNAGFPVCDGRGRDRVRAQEMRDPPRGASDSWCSRDFRLDQVGGGDGYHPEKAGAAETAGGGSEGAAVI